MIDRKIEQKLLDWKQQELKLPLVIKGARQVGKTTSVLEFAKKHYETVYELNFYKNPSIATIFNDDLDADTLLSKISFKFPTRIFQKGKTLFRCDHFKHLPCDRIDGTRHRLTDMHVSAISSAGVLWSVADRMIVYYR